MQVEQAFQHFVAMAFKDVTQSQIEAMRVVWFSGAWWLLQHTMAKLTDDEEPTAADLEMMESIHTELETFVAALAAKGATHQ